MAGLAPSSTVYYKVGDDANGWSSVKSITVPRARGARGAVPMRIAFVGDLGITGNSSSTVAHVLANHADIPLEATVHVGDLSYADQTEGVWNTFWLSLWDLPSRTCLA